MNYDDPSVRQILDTRIGEQYTAEECQFENDFIGGEKALVKRVYVIYHWYRNRPKVGTGVGGDVTLLNVYYIIDGQILRSPTVYDVLATRAARAAGEIAKGLEEKEWEIVGGLAVRELERVKREREEREEKVMGGGMDDDDDDDGKEEELFEYVLDHETRGLGKKAEFFDKLEKRFMKKD